MSATQPVYYVSFIAAVAVSTAVGALVGIMLTLNYTSRKRSFRRVNLSVDPKTKGTKKNQPPKQSSCCGGNADLQRHTHIFKKQILQVKKNVHVAIGYALANCIMIEGDEGIIIIDVTESVQVGQEVLKEFRKITHKPVVALIYTHFHTDHVGGSGAFLTHDQAIPDCAIWGHRDTGEKISEFNSIVGPIAFVRGAKQFGTYLSHPTLENCGIGPFLRQSMDDEMSLTNLPNRTYTGKKDIVISGVHLTLISAPGETDDQTVVFMPEHKILFAADNYYESFPNLYTIRGAPNRDTVQWARSLDVMIATQPDILIPSHTLPVHGRDEIHTRLTNYRDAIQYVHDQTVRMMLQGYHPDDIAAMIQLPSNLLGLEYLKEFYGTVGWSAKGIFNGYMGWFSGDECDLWKLAPSEYAERLVDLVDVPSDAGSNNYAKVLAQAEKAYAKNDFQWALELSSALLRLDKCSATVAASARALKTKCCHALGDGQISANGRNWYMTSALINQGTIEVQLPQELRRNAIKTIPFDSIFKAMGVRLKADGNKMVGVHSSVCFRLMDLNVTWRVYIRNSVLYYEMLEGATCAEDSTIILETTDKALREMLAVDVASIAKSLGVSGMKFKKGNLATFLLFVNNFDRSY